MFFDLASSCVENCFSVLNACWTKQLFSHLKKLHIPYETTNLRTTLTRLALFYGTKPLAVKNWQEKIEISRNLQDTTFWTAEHKKEL
jgi:hypothetical protein